MTSTVESATCELDAEPLRRYKAGGYHPLHLGDRFKSGRYEVLHKLGWGGYATVWLAKDHKLVVFSLSRRVCSDSFTVLGDP